MRPDPDQSLPGPPDDAIYDPRFLRFLDEHREADVARLLLGKAPPGVDLRAAAEQIVARRKARAKLPDWYASGGLVFPPPVSVEQASSAPTADYKASLVTGDCLVDLSGGMGVDTLAFTRRFRRVLYVERDAELCRRFAHNAGRLGERPVEVVNADALEFVRSFTGRATFYVDPARRDATRQRVFLFEDCSPNLLELLPLLRDRADAVLVKASPRIDLAAGLGQLHPVREAHVVSVANECKEVLFLVDFAFAGEPRIRCVDLSGERAPVTFEFDLAGERAAPVEYGAAGRYLYDPNTSIRKAGAFRSIGHAFGLAKVAPSTHLYTAPRLVDGFPGRVFEVEAEADRHVRRQLPGGRASVIVRNHPLAADQLRERLRLQDGGDRYVIGFRDAADKPRLVIARRVA